MSQKAILEFRKKFRSNDIPSYYSGSFHLWATNIICLSVIGFSVFFLYRVQLFELIIIPIAFLITNFGEYIAHRFPMHRKWPGLMAAYRRHMNHHQFFSHELMSGDDKRDYAITLFPVLLVCGLIGFFAVPMAVLLKIYVSQNVGLLFLLTASVYLLNYEWLHLIYHLPEKSWILRNHLIANLRQLHLDHHNPQIMMRYNFNISYPLMDWLLGTRFKK